MIKIHSSGRIYADQQRPADDAPSIWIAKYLVRRDSEEPFELVLKRTARPMTLTEALLLLPELVPLDDDRQLVSDIWFARPGEAVPEIHATCAPHREMPMEGALGWGEPREG